ncbi:MAG: hypothetical protein U0271_36025 [Polyangiaceae bacterium]
MNWFIALPISPAGWFDERVTSPPKGTTLFHRDDLHMTIAFLGSCGSERAHAAWAAMRWPLGPVSAQLEKVVPLGPPKRFSALSATCTEPRPGGRNEPPKRIEAAMDVARHDAARAAAVTVDPRPPLAHVTLARPRRNATPDERKAALAWASALELGAPTIDLARLALYTWAEDRGRPGSRAFRIVEERAV